MQRSLENEIVFVIESCQNCKGHHWNTRHDETKYEGFAQRISSAISERIPDAVVLRNQIPKSYLPYDLYVNLIPNEDDNNPIFDQVPRTGAFEVSYKGMLLFSKLQSGFWPNIQLVAEKCYMLIQDEQDKKDLSKYLAGNSPKKVGDGKRQTRYGSPSKGNDFNGSFSQSVKQGNQQRDQPNFNQTFNQSQSSNQQQIRQQEQQQNNYQSQGYQQNQQKKEQSQQQQIPQQESQNLQQNNERTMSKSSSKFIDTAKQNEQTVSHQSLPKNDERNDSNINNQEEEYEPKEPEEAEEQPQPESDQDAGLHLKTPDDLKGFPVFPPGTKSLLSKHLSRDIWNQLKDSKDQFGFTFKQSIFSGCQNVDSGIGVYAGSQDSYKAFSTLYDLIIEDYHGHKKSDNHKSDINYTKLDTPELPQDEADMIISTRIRVGRNLAEFPLGPGLTKDQRKQVEEKVVQALQTFDGELSGKYSALSDLSDDDRKQLIENHFLFKEGDRFLEACGLNRDWPDGRGIFHNNNKTFLVWVNEEDQLRIISMQQGADINAVFQRLANACNKIEKVAKFAHDEHLGYITSCPTNLGTALRASVHIKLPYLGQQKELFQEIADKYHVQIRGAHGEHTETNDHIYDISNKRRLGRSEVELVQDMYNGVKAMISKEKELMPKIEKVEEEKETQCGSHLSQPEDLKGKPVFTEQTKSLLSKHLTQKIWDKLKNEKDEFGYTFKQAIFSGCQNLDSGIGIYAGSHSSYKVFCDLFDKVIEDYHGHDKQAKHASNLDFNQLNTPPLSEEEAKLIKSTRIRVGRNLADYPLGPGLSREQRNEIEKKIIQSVSSFEGELSGKYYALSSLSDDEREQLIEDHFLFKEGDRFLEACGLNRDWPEGRGIFHNNDKTFLVWVNEEDQLRIISMQQGADIGQVFERLSKACSQIEKVAQFAHDDHLGYITSCPTNLGTALRASVHIHLPNLGQNKEEFQKIADHFHVQIRGAHGEHSESNDFIFDISNKRRLGRSEVELVQDMYNGVKEMIKRELELQPKEEKNDIQNTEQKRLNPDELNNPEDLKDELVFPPNTNSLLAKNLTPELYQKMKDLKDNVGFTFKQAIFSGCKNLDSSIGAYAGSQGSYVAFAELFDKIINDYHSFTKEQQNYHNLDASQLNCPQLPEDESSMIISTRIRVGRNLKDYPLGPAITREQRKEVEQKIVQCFDSFEENLQGKYYSLSELTEEQRNQLVEDHFLFKEGDRFLEACGLNRDWPEGRGIFHNNDKTFLVWVNEEDQLRIISMQKDSNIKEVFERLQKACEHIEKVAQFAYDDHLGYITSCPTNLGTALRASVHIKLPKLGADKTMFKEIADKYHVQIRGIHGEHSESADHIYDISNKRRLGYSEVQLVQDMYDGVKALIEKEKELQTQ